MGRYKSVEIEALFFKKYSETFHNSLFKAFKNSKVSEEQFFNKVSPKFKKLVSNYDELLASQHLKYHKFEINSFLKTHFGVQKKIAITHKAAFIPYFLYINGCAIAYGKIINQSARKRIDSTLKMNVALYGLIVRRAEQIGTLLLNGYIDGAMIVWRSLYENAVILLLLAKENDPMLADKFYAHALRNSKKNAASYDRCYKELKFPPLAKSTHKKLQESSENIKQKYGKDFLESEYGWADELFPGNQKANFRSIEERVEMGKYRPYYLACSEHTHSNFNGLKNYMTGNRIVLSELLVKDIELSAFVDPMQFTISVLHDVNDYILYEFSTSNEYEANVLLMRKIFEMQQASFDLRNVTKTGR